MQIAMGTWGPGIFSDDEAADARGDWRDAVIRGEDLEAATDHILRGIVDAKPGPRQDPYAANVWIALAVAQFKTGRLERSRPRPGAGVPHPRRRPGALGGSGRGARARARPLGGEAARPAAGPKRIRPKRLVCRAVRARRRGPPPRSGVRRRGARLRRRPQRGRHMAAGRAARLGGRRRARRGDDRRAAGRAGRRPPELHAATEASTRCTATRPSARTWARSWPGASSGRRSHGARGTSTTWPQLARSLGEPRYRDGLALALEPERLAEVQRELRRTDALSRIDYFERKVFDYESGEPLREPRNLVKSGGLHPRQPLRVPPAGRARRVRALGRAHPRPRRRGRVAPHARPAAIDANPGWVGQRDLVELAEVVRARAEELHTRSNPPPYPAAVDFRAAADRRGLRGLQQLARVPAGGGVAVVGAEHPHELADDGRRARAA